MSIEQRLRWRAGAQYENGMPDRSLSIVDSTAFLVPTLAKSIAAARQLASAPDPVGLSERKMPRRLTRPRQHLPARKASASLREPTSCGWVSSPPQGNRCRATQESQP